MLAFEPLEISEPVLARSPVITEDDLLTLAREDVEHRLLIARRPRVSEPVSAAIAKYREADCLMALARNEARRAVRSQRRRLRRHRQADESLQTALSKRTDMGAGLARAIYAIAGEVVKESLLAAYPDLASGIRWRSPWTRLLFARRKATQDAGALTETLARWRADQGGRAARGAQRPLRHRRPCRGAPNRPASCGLAPRPVALALARLPFGGPRHGHDAEEACALYIAFADIGRAHAVTPDALGKASAQVYQLFARDDARRALHRLGAGGSIAKTLLFCGPKRRIFHGFAFFAADRDRRARRQSAVGGALWRSRIEDSEV
jgi:hypothetical protein